MTEVRLYKTPRSISKEYRLALEAYGNKPTQENHMRLMIAYANWIATRKEVAIQSNG